jgi:hypothetical protein
MSPKHGGTTSPGHGWMVHARDQDGEYQIMGHIDHMHPHPTKSWPCLQIPGLGC